MSDYEECIYALKPNEINAAFLEIHSIWEGFDYTFYDADYNEIDGGVADVINVDIETIAAEVAKSFRVKLSQEMPYDELIDLMR